MTSFTSANGFGTKLSGCKPSELSFFKTFSWDALVFAPQTSPAITITTTAGIGLANLGTRHLTTSLTRRMQIALTWLIRRRRRSKLDSAAPGTRKSKDGGTYGIVTFGSKLVRTKLNRLTQLAIVVIYGSCKRSAIRVGVRLKMPMRPI